jgi:thioredoxin-like negative regulator of GroEL
MNLESLQELNKIIEKESALMLYFYNDDCPPCISLRPKVESLVADKFPNMKLAWINAKKHPEIPANFQVFANPAILVFFEGKEFKRFSKYISTDELYQSIQRVYQLMFD